MKPYLVRCYQCESAVTYEILSVAAKNRKDVIEWAKSHHLIKPRVFEITDEETIRWYKEGRIEADFVLNYVS